MNPCVCSFLFTIIINKSNMRCSMDVCILTQPSYCIPHFYDRLHFAFLSIWDTTPFPPRPIAWYFAFSLFSKYFLPNLDFGYIFCPLGWQDLPLFAPLTWTAPKHRFSILSKTVIFIWIWPPGAGSSHVFWPKSWLFSLGLSWTLWTSSKIPIFLCRSFLYDRYWRF